MVRLHDEYLLQDKGTMYHDVERSCIDPNEDDYFVIGPSNERFAPSIAYRNLLKHRMQSHQTPLNGVSTKFGQTVQKTIHLTNPQLQDTAISRQDEAVQTDGPRTELEKEIYEIREDLERRRRELRQRAKDTDEREKYEQGKDKTQARSSLMKQIQYKGHARKPETYKVAKDTAVQQTVSRSMRRQQSLSPGTQHCLSEYQWAYRTPEKCFISPRRSAQHMADHRINHFKPRTAVIDYETEYQHEYRPFKYVTDEFRKSTCITDEVGVNMIPLPRPRSAAAPKGLSQEPHAPHEERSTPIPRLEKGENGDKRRRYLSESSVKYRDFSDPKKIGRWLREITELRQKAESYCSRERESHFTREHLAQLDSSYVKCWDELSSDLCPENCAINRMFPNSYASEIKSNCNKNMSLHSNQRAATFDARHNTLDSRDVKEVMRTNEPWSTSSDVTDDFTGATRMSQSQTYLNDWAREYDQRTTGVNTEWQHCGQNGTSVSQECLVSSPKKTLCLKESGDESTGHMSNGQIRLEEKTKCHKRARCDSTGALSPATARSTNPSVRMASETLQKARKQYERVFREYADKQESCYSPLNYVNHVCSMN